MAIALLLHGHLARASETETALEECRVIASDRRATPEQQKVLIERVSHPDRRLRAAAILAVRRLSITDAETLSALAKNLDDADEQARSISATALMDLGPKGEQILRERLHSVKLPLARRMEAMLALRSRFDGLVDPELEKVMKAMFAEIGQANHPSPAINGAGPVNSPLFSESSMGSEWLLLVDGSKGEAVYDSNRPGRESDGSLRLSKLTPGGEVTLRSRRPLFIPKGQAPTVRLFFQSDDAPMNSALQIRFENVRTGGLSIGDVQRGHTAQSQTMLRNSPRQRWLKRIAVAPRASQDSSYFIRVTLSGNPATVWLSDFSAPATPYRYLYPPGMETLADALKDDKAPERKFDSEAHSVELVKQSTQPESAARVRLEVDGKAMPPVLYFAMRGSFGEYAGMNRLGEVPFLVVPVPLNDLEGDHFPPYQRVWTGVDRFDFTTPLDWLDQAARKAPDGFFILNFHVAWPSDWIAQHPEETWKNSEGKKGYGSSIRFYGFADKLPQSKEKNSASTLRWWPSPFSKPALDSASEGIRRFMEAVKDRPYAGRIVGCFISGGHDGQFYTAWPDYSRPAQEAFNHWLSQRYKTDAALQEAWGDPAITLSSVRIPDIGTRDGKGAQEIFLSAVDEQRYVDQRQFQAEQGMVIRDQLAKAFKDAIARPAIGMTWQLGGGRGQGSDTLLPDSRGLDMIVSQPAYELRQPGYIGGLKASLGSLARYGKMVIKELDLRTWIRAGGAEIPSDRLGTAMSPEAFAAIFRKEAAEMIAAGHGYWLFDIGMSHFRDPEMLKVVAESVQVYRDLELEMSAPYRPEVAIAWSAHSSYWISDWLNSANIFNRLERYQFSAIKSMGVPIEEVDLSELLARQEPISYRMVIIPNAWRLTEVEKAQIREKLQKNGRVIVWSYAAGYVSDRGASVETVGDLAGMRIRSEKVSQLPHVRFAEGESEILDGLAGVPGMSEMSNRVMGGGESVPSRFLRFVVDDATATPLATYEDGAVAMAIKEQGTWTSVYSGALGGLDGRLLNRLAARVGVTCRSDAPVWMAFNGRFLSLHAVQNGSLVLHLPEKSRVTEYFGGKELALGNQIRLTLEAGETRWLRVEPVP